MYQKLILFFTRRVGLVTHFYDPVFTFILPSHLSILNPSFFVGAKGTLFPSLLGPSHFTGGSHPVGDFGSGLTAQVSNGYTSPTLAILLSLRLPCRGRL